MADTPQTNDVLIVGAGIAGLAAATELQAAGRTVLVVDKGRGLGGRLASRRIGAATFDHGAQFMTAKHPRFAAAVAHWHQLGVVAEWYRGSGATQIRWRGNPAMTAIAKHLARDLPVQLQKRIVSLRCLATGWLAEADTGETFEAHAVILTPPIPQALALLDAGKVDVLPEIRAQLAGIQYERCLAVMAMLDAPARIPPPGGLVPPEGPIAWIADNQMKGISPVPAVTLHATPAFSLENWDVDRTLSGQVLLQAAAPWLGARVTEFQVHAWRYCKPIQVLPATTLMLGHTPPLFLAGDAFGGPRVEGAALSGWAAAEALQKRFSQA
jgi:hypothetical protein